MKHRLFVMMMVCLGISLSGSAERTGATYIESPIRAKAKGALMQSAVQPYAIDLPVENTCESPKKVDEAVYEVKCTFKYDPALYTPNYVAAHAVDFVMREYSWGEENEELFLYLPAGTYDMHGEVWRNTSIGDGIGVIIQENVVVNSDMEVVFDTETLTNHIEVNTIAPDGERCVLPTWRMINEPPYYEIVDPGTVNSMLVYQFYIHDDYGIISTLYGSGDYIDVDSGRNGERIFDYYFSDLSDKYTLCQVRLLPTNEGCYIVKNYTEDLTQKLVVNDPTAFQLYEESFVATPARELYDNDDYLTTMQNKVIVDGVSRGGFTVLSKSESPKYYLDICQESADRVFPVEVLVVPSLTDIHAPIIVQDVDWDGNPYEYEDILDSKLYGVSVWQTADGFKYIKNNHSLDNEISFQKTETSEFYVNEFPAHPGFSFDKKTTAYGNNCPVGVFGNMSYVEGESINSTTHLRYVGRYGEIRQSDLLGLSATLTVGESTNITDYAEACKYLYGTHEADKFKFTIVNKNVKVDDVDGVNMLEMYWDETGGDLAAPTLQMLQFKNAEGEITDRFGKTADGVIEFAGGDFTYNYVDYYNSWFDCNQLTVKAEYSPFATNDWKEIKVEEIDDLYFMPGFGYFYRGSLADVEGESSNGWYDVRLSLTDAAGNYQTQTISPAFKIDASLGVNKIIQKDVYAVNNGEILVVRGMENTNVELYSADGRFVQKGSNSELNIAALPAGLYIVKVDNGENVVVLKTLKK